MQVYGAYGERTGSPGHSHSGFTGEVIESDTGCYMLGERLYSPTLRRFLGPDGSSPFDEGGFNRYAYCAGDPMTESTSANMRSWQGGPVIP
jgi:RHS repeat-associated protein